MRSEQRRLNDVKERLTISQLLLKDLIPYLMPNGPSNLIFTTTKYSFNDLFRDISHLVLLSIIEYLKLNPYLNI